MKSSSLSLKTYYRKAGTLPAALIKPLANSVPTYLHHRPFQMISLRPDLCQYDQTMHQDTKKVPKASVRSHIPATEQVSNSRHQKMRA